MKMTSFQPLRQTQLENEILNWQDFDTKFGNLSKYDGLIELGKNLENVATLVHLGEPTFALFHHLQALFESQPESVKPFIHLEATCTLFAELEESGNLDECTTLLDEQVNLILNDILQNRKILAEEIVIEGEKCSIKIGCAQFVNLVEAWRDIDKSGAKRKSKKQLIEIDTLIKQTAQICDASKQLMEQYVQPCSDSQTKKKILSELEANNGQIRDGYKQCTALIENLKLEIGSKILTLKFVDFKQGEALKLNPRRALKKLTLDIVKNPLLVFAPLAFGTAAGLNYGTKKAVQSSLSKLNKIREKLQDLEQALSEIETEKIKNEEFLRLN